MKLRAPLATILLVFMLSGCANMLVVDPLDMTGSEAVGITTVEARNAMQDRLLTQSDAQCNALIRRLQERPRKVSLSMQIVTVILASWATASPSDLTTGLTAGAAGFTALDQALGASNPDDVGNAIAGIRLAQRLLERDIDAGRASELDEYGPYEAVRDAERYHGVCTVAEGRAQSARARSAGIDSLMQ